MTCFRWRKLPTNILNMIHLSPIYNSLDGTPNHHLLLLPKFVVLSITPLSTNLKTWIFVNLNIQFLMETLSLNAIKHFTYVVLNKRQLKNHQSCVSLATHSFSSGPTYPPIGIKPPPLHFPSRTCKDMGNGLAPCWSHQCIFYFFGLVCFIIK